MSNSLRSIKRYRDIAGGELSPEQQKLPSGRVLTQPLRGSFLSLPLLAWPCARDRRQTPLVMMVLALMSKEMDGILGTLELELPFHADTEAPILAALERYGWAGSIWALGDPPPRDNTELAEVLKGLLEGTMQNLKATLVFESDPTTGASFAQTIEVTRAKGRFLMPPLPQPNAAPDDKRLQLLRDLVAGHVSFFQDKSHREVGRQPTST